MIKLHLIHKVYPLTGLSLEQFLQLPTEYAHLVLKECIADNVRTAVNQENIMNKLGKN